MAKFSAVWGIDVGQCAVKALRCREGDEPGKLIADAFDYIEYPKILSQPEADPEALVREALEQFLSRNSVRGDGVAISVPGQSGLARFIKLPPVESKKIPDIVKYEARQQIPFALEDVVWDYQQMAGGSVEEGFALETEVGLFAMKRDQVARALEPFEEAGIEVDFVQLTPLALYNYCAFDQIEGDLNPEEYDPDSPPESTVLVSLGTDTTDLVVTNGYRVWQRSIPLGGNHFTRALTKELKLTFAKAEHLKRNAAAAEDPKRVFQAMRPVFNDLLAEVQRSMGYFTNIDRNAKLGRIIGLGNAMKLPGLQRYLSQNLGKTVVKLDSFRTLAGPGVVDSPAFKANVLCFASCYGLAIQGLRQAKIETNLLPREIMQDRMIRSKQPWAVGALSVLLLGFLISSLGYWRAWNSADVEDFSTQISGAQRVSSRSGELVQQHESANSAMGNTRKLMDDLLGIGGDRTEWLQLWKAMNLALPRDPEGERPDAINQRSTLYIDRIESEYISNLSNWWNADYRGMKISAHFAAQKLPPPGPAEPPAEGEDAAAADNGNAALGNPQAGGMQPQGPGLGPGGQGPKPPQGAGWVFRLVGYHFHNNDAAPLDSTKLYVIKTLVTNLYQPTLTDQGGTAHPVGDLGIIYPVALERGYDREFRLGGDGNDGDAQRLPALPRYRFEVQFGWQPQDDDADNNLPGGGQVAAVP